MKVCSTCGVEKGLEFFHKNVNGKQGVDCQCKICKTTSNKRWFEANRDKHLAMLRKSANKRHAARKKNAVNAYGGACARCGETDIDVLTVDHINNDGNAHRKELAHGRDPRRIGSSAVYRELEKLGYPSGYQILCFNCNIKKHLEKIREIP